MAVWAEGVWAAGVWAPGVWDEAASPMPPVFSGQILDRQLEVDVPMTTLFLADFFDPDPDSYSLISGSLPAGVSLNTSTGAVSGTPTVVGAASVQFRGTNADGSDDTNVFSLNVVQTAELQETRLISRVGAYDRIGRVRSFDRIMVVVQ